MKNIDAIVWDMDGVKYSFGLEFWDACRLSAATVAMKYIKGLEKDQAIKMALASWDKYHSSYDFLFKEHGIDENVAVEEYHDNISIDFIQPATPEYLQLLEDCGTEHVVLTQGIRSWANRVLTKLEIADRFGINRLTTLEEFRPYKKSDSTKPFEIALDKIKCAPEKSVMVEDSQKNLKFAKELGMTTVLIGKPESEAQENFTDFSFSTTNDFLLYFKSIRLAA